MTGGYTEAEKMPFDHGEVCCVGARPLVGAYLSDPETEAEVVKSL